MTNEIKEMNFSEMLFNRDERLLDYITNLQEKVNLYENPDDMTLFYMWLDEKAKDKMKQLQEENEKQHKGFLAVCKEAKDLEQRIDKATDYLLDKYVRGLLGDNEVNNVVKILQGDE